MCVLSIVADFVEGLAENSAKGAVELVGSLLGGMLVLLSLYSHFIQTTQDRIYELVWSNFRMALWHSPVLQWIASWLSY